MSNKDLGIIFLSSVLALAGVSSFHGQTNSTKTRQQQSMGTDEIRSVQQALKDVGFDPGPIDGIMGPKTRRAIIAFQQQQQLRETGVPDAQTRSALEIAVEQSDQEQQPPAAPETPAVPKLEEPAPSDDSEQPDVPEILSPPLQALPSLPPQQNETPGTTATMGIGSASVMEDIRLMQMALRNQGFDPGEINGLISTQTQQALRDFQAANNLPVTGVLDSRTQAALGVVVRGTSNPDSSKAEPQNGQAEFQLVQVVHQQTPAQPPAPESDAIDKEITTRLQKSSEVLLNMTQMKTDKRIPQELLQRAEALAAVFFVVFLACFLPARRAAAIDPLSGLRAE